jgi:signal transduction histidine kinase
MSAGAWLQRNTQPVALALWLAGVAFHAVALSLMVLMLLGVSSGDVDAQNLIPTPGGLMLPTFGLLIIRRWPNQPLGWLFLVYGLLGAAQVLVVACEILASDEPWPGIVWVMWLGAVTAFADILILLTIVPLLFPTGRLLSPRWRAPVILSATTIVVTMLHGAFAAPLVGDPFIRQAPNPARFGPVAAALDLIAPLGIIVFPVMLLCGIVSLVVRYRRSRGVERLQIRWLIWMCGLIILLVLIVIIGELLFPETFNTKEPWTFIEHVLGLTIQTLSFAGIPLVLGIAILRYRLYSIDLIINRTLVYLALSACIIGIYVFVVGWLGNVFHTGGNLLFSLLATAVVAVLFQPLRERIQRGVNRLLFGERDEPYAVLSRLGRRLEDTLVPDAVLITITDTVREALRLPYSAIALGDGPSWSIVVASGAPVSHPVRVPLLYQHEPVGDLLLGPRAPGEEFSPADRRLLDDLARQAGIAVHAVQLTHDLQLARERLVGAREEERRRLRRDLHDGLGSQLAALNLQAGAVRRLIDSDPEAAQAEVAELRSQLQAAIASIRTLVHGLRPPAIDELGLLLALRERARQYSDAGLVVDTVLPQALPTLPAAVEVAVYRITEEALVNVVRHAQARWCSVRLRVEDGIHLHIEDDGIGITPSARAGVGMLSMRERAEELGGRCVIEPRQGGGTRVSVALPFSRLVD